MKLTIATIIYAMPLQSFSSSCCRYDICQKNVHPRSRKIKCFIKKQGMGGLVYTATHSLPFPEITFKSVECNLWRGP